MPLCSNLTRAQSNRLYLDIMQAKDNPSLRRLCQEDLFFFLTIACKRPDINRDWLYDRCREVEAAPDGYLDLWAREHYKSTIITFGKSIQDILTNPEITIGIFSHTRPIAKGFMEQIKRELETNTFLQGLFSDVLYADPRKEAPSWSLDGGLLVKRKSNPKEKTVEAWGLVDGQPTSKHFSLLVYDDVVTRESVTTTDQIQKVTDAWALSLNLGAQGGARRYIGTRYHFNDTYKAMMDRKAATVRLRPAKDKDGHPVFLSTETLESKRREMGPYIFGAQMLQDPIADKAMGFKEEWLKFYDGLKRTGEWNHYVLVDPASEKKRTSDYTVIAVIALAPDNNYYLVDAVRDRMNLSERTRKLFEFVRRYRPLAVGYEKYGMQSDIEHVQDVQERENYRFKIVPLGGNVAKEDRIRRLVPVFENGRFWLPHTLMFVDYERTAKDFVRDFIQDEYLAFPVAVHDDMLDCIARVVDSELEARFPELNDERLPSVTLRQGDHDRVQTDYDVLNG